MNCQDCEVEGCCNNLVHELRNGNVSLSYVQKEIAAGRITEGLVERMRFEIDRIDTALKHCINKTCD